MISTSSRSTANAPRRYERAVRCTLSLYRGGQDGTQEWRRARGRVVAGLGHRREERWSESLAQTAGLLNRAGDLRSALRRGQKTRAERTLGCASRLNDERSAARWTAPHSSSNVPAEDVMNA